MAFPSLSIGDLTAKMPIVQGGMGVGISLSGLASAVANQGGIGVIAGAMIGMKEPDVAKNPIEANLRALRQELTKAREKTQGIIGVNIMVALTTFSQMVRTAIENRADIIFSGAGLPLEMPKHLLQACEEKKEEFKTKLVPIVSSARAATLIARKWLSRFDSLPDASASSVKRSTTRTSPWKSWSPRWSKPPSALKTRKAAPCPSSPPAASTPAKTSKNSSTSALPASRWGPASWPPRNVMPMTASSRATLLPAKKTSPSSRARWACPAAPCRTTSSRPPARATKSPSNASSTACIPATISAMKGNLERGFAFCGANVARVNSIVSVKELMESLQQEFDQTISKGKQTLQGLLK